MAKTQLNLKQPDPQSENNCGPSHQRQYNGKSQQEIEDEIFREHKAVSERTPLLAASKSAPLYSDPVHTRAESSTLESAQSPNTTQKQPEFYKVIQKWWQELSTATKWIIIAAIIFLFQLLFFLISLKIVAPITTRKAIEKAELSFDSIEVENTGSSFNLMGMATIRNLGNVKITSDPTKLDVYYLDNLLGNIDLPALTLSPQDNQFSINSTLQALEPTIMEDFVNDMILTDYLEWNLQGSMNFYSKAATIKGYSLNKKLTITGFNGAKEIQLHSLNLNSDGFDHGVSFTAELSFWNPSNITLRPGNLAFGLFYRNFQIAHGSTVDQVLAHGNNDWLLSGSMATISDDATYMTEFLNKYLKGDLLNMEIRGLGSESTQWLDKGMRNIQTEVQVQGDPEPVYITDMTVTNSSINFDEQDYSINLNGVFHANLRLPTAFKTLPIRIQQRSEVCVYRLEKCVPFARFDVPSSSMQAAVEEGFVAVKADLADIQLIALPDSQKEFSQVIQDFFTSDSLVFQVTGHTIITAETAIGLLDLELDSFTEFVDIKGLSALQHPPIDITSVEMANGSQELTFESVVILQSDSSILLRVGPVMLDLMHEDKKIGETWIPDLEIHPGQNNITTRTRLMTSDESHLNATISSLFSQHIQGADLTLTAKGNSRSSRIEPLNEIMQHYSHTFTIPGHTGSLIEGTVFHMFFGSVSTQITNPIKELPLKIRSLNATFNMESSKIGDVSVQFREGAWFTPLNIPPNQSLRTPRLPVSFTEEGFKKLKANQGNEVELDIDTKLDVEVNKVPIHVTYKAYGVVAKVNSWFFTE